MNILKGLCRFAPNIRNAPQINIVAKHLSTATTTPIVDPTHQPMQNVVELDKLFKKVEIEMRGVDPAVLLSYSWFCVAAASHLGIEVTKNWALRKAEKERYTLLRAVHIYKKHRVQYEIRTYFRFLHLQRLTGSTCDTYLEYIERNLPEGCALKITKVECVKLPDHITPPAKAKFS